MIKSQISNLKSQNLEKGFTLLEVLVGVAIAAMIMSFTMASMRSAKQRNRDARRESDMKQLQNALGLYATNAGLYPICASEVVVGSAGDTCLTPALMSSQATQGRVPTDPLGAVSGACGGLSSYVYCYQSVNGFTYTIRYALETDTIPGKSIGWQTATP